jgi:hypothetical protein
MNGLLKEILPAGPLRYLFLAVGVFYYAYPQLRRYWFEVRFRDAQLDHARRELEVLKLRYEIEALAKEKGLPLPAWPVMMRNLPSGEAAPSTVLSKLIGGILPSLRFFYASPVAFSLSSSVW